MDDAINIPVNKRKCLDSETESRCIMAVVYALNGTICHTVAAAVGWQVSCRQQNYSLEAGTFIDRKSLLPCQRREDYEAN